MKRIKNILIDSIFILIIFVIFNILIDSIFILIIFVIFNILITKYVAKTELKYEGYIVKSGDTIWSIATDLAKQNSEKYIKSIINDIKRLNSL